MSVKHWKYLATGTGRCGTGYFAQVLNSLGIKCSHEGMFTPTKDPEYEINLRFDNAWWEWEGESSWLAAPWLDYPRLKNSDVKIVHLVRHPKKVIDSQMRIKAFEDNPNPFLDYQYQHLPELNSIQSPFVKAAYFYVAWNKMIEKCERAIFHRIEDDITILLDKLEIDYQGKEIFSKMNYNSRVGWEKSDVNLYELPNPLLQEIILMSERYGYEI